MADPMPFSPNSYSPNGGAPGAFTVRPITRWFVCDLPEAQDPEGDGAFAIKVRTNPTYGDLRAEGKAMKEGDDAYFAAIANRVVAWTAMAEDETGAVVPIPPPAEAGPMAFYAVPDAFIQWVIQTVMTAHRGDRDPKGPTSSAAAAPTPGPSSGPTDPRTGDTG